MDLSSVSIEELQRLLDERVAKAKEEQLLAEQKAKEEEEQKIKDDQKEVDELQKTWDMLKRKHEEEMLEQQKQEEQQMDLDIRNPGEVLHYQTEHYLFEKKGKQVHLKLDKIYDDDLPEEVKPKDELVYQSVSVDGKIVDVKIKDKIVCEAERLKKGGMIWLL
jgi:N-methylhydantoinase A/oxoprolinase/acetone carboxylase beta subunit